MLLQSLNMLTYYLHCIPDNAALNPQSEIGNFECIIKYIMTNVYKIVAHKSKESVFPSFV